MMGGFAAAAPAIISAVGNTAPALIAGRQPDPTGAMTGPVMGGGQAQRPQGISTAAQTGMNQQDQLLQMLLAIMQGLSQQQFGQGQPQQPQGGPPNAG